MLEDERQVCCARKTEMSFKALELISPNGLLRRLIAAVNVRSCVVSMIDA